MNLDYLKRHIYPSLGGMARRGGCVLLIYTGGTIGMGRNPDTEALEPLDFKFLLKQMPEFSRLKTSVDVHQFETPMDSSDMNHLMWAELVRIISSNYEKYDGFVILHGTDTMAYTASALSFMLQNLTKPVILTGSQLPMGQLRTDGKENMLTSIELATLLNEEGHSPIPEVCIYFSGHLMRGNRSTKQSAEEFNAFHSFNYPHLCEAGVNFNFAEPYILQPNWEKPMKPHFIMEPNILVFSLFPGLQEQMLHHVFDNPALRGVVMRTYGSGNAPQTPWLMESLKKASDRGVVIVNISQCMAGKVEMSRYGNGLGLIDAGVISGYDSTIEAATTKLMHLCAHKTEYEDIVSHMKRNLAGEITI